EVAPGEHCAGVAEVEEDAVPAAHVERVEAAVLRIAIARRDVVVEDDELRRDLGERAERLGRRRDVDEDDDVAVEGPGVEAVVVAARDVAALVAPGAPHGPRRAEAVRAAGVVEADLPHAGEGTEARRGRLSTAPPRRARARARCARRARGGEALRRAGPRRARWRRACSAARPAGCRAGPRDGPPSTGRARVRGRSRRACTPPSRG